MAISFSFLFMRISSSRLFSVRFVMRVHWIMRVFCGGIIIVPTAVVSCCASGFGSFWFMTSVFQFWLSFIWFVAGLCCIRSVSVRSFIICWIFSGVVSRVFAVSSRLCQTLSLKRVSSFSSFVDMVLPSVEFCFCCFVAYILLGTFRLDYRSVLDIYSFDAFQMFS